MSDAPVLDEAPLAYFEWSVDPAEFGVTESPEKDPDGWARLLADRAAWAAANPALGIRLSEWYIAGVEKPDMTDEDFARERLGIFPDDEEGVPKPIPLDWWDACLDAESKLVGRPSFAFDVAPDRSSSAIAVAGKRADGLQHWEVVDVRPGTGWVVDRLGELRAKWSPASVVCDPAGPAGSLLKDGKACPTVGSSFEVATVTLREHGQACGQLLDAVKDRKGRHTGAPGLEAMLRAALNGAAKRDVGDVWLWSRTKATVDISPLVAVTLAARAAQSVPGNPRVLTMDDLRALAGEGAADAASPADARPDGDPAAEGVPGVTG